MGSRKPGSVWRLRRPAREGGVCVAHRGLGLELELERLPARASHMPRRHRGLIAATHAPRRHDRRWERRRLPSRPALTSPRRRCTRPSMRESETDGWEGGREERGGPGTGHTRRRVLLARARQPPVVASAAGERVEEEETERRGVRATTRASESGRVEEKDSLRTRPREATGRPAATSPGGRGGVRGGGGGDRGARGRRREASCHLFLADTRASVRARRAGD